MSERDELIGLRRLKAARESGDERGELDALRQIKRLKADPSYMPGGQYPAKTTQPEPGGMVVSSREIIEGIGNKIAGEGEMEFPDMPDIGELTMQTGMGTGVSHLPAMNATSLHAGLVSGTSPEQIRDVALHNLPGSSQRQDAMGNLIVDWEGKSYYAAKPGFRTQDAKRLAIQGVLYGKVASTVSKALSGVLTRMAGVGAATGATAAGLDLGATAAGSRQGIDLPRAITAGVAGGTFEAFLPAFNAIARAGTGGPQMARGGKTGTSHPFSQPGASRMSGADITPEGQRVLREAGIDPADLTDEMVALFAKVARGAADPEDAARYAANQGLPVPIRETRGTITRLPSDQMFESQSAKGAYGKQAETTMRDIFAQRQEQARANVPAIQARLSGGRAVLNEPGQAGAMAQHDLVAGNRRAGVAVDAAYTAARGAPAEVVTGSQGGLTQFADDAHAAAATFLKSPNAGGAVTQADDLIRIASSDELSVPVEDLFLWREATSKLYRNAANKTEAAGLKKLLSSFDDNVESMVKNSLLEGDEQAARKWLRAVHIRKGQGRRYESNDLIADLVETEYAGGGRRLKVAPESASNLIFGKSNVGFTTKPELSRELYRLRERLGADSEGWRALREEAFLRFVRQAEGAYEGAERNFSGAKFLKAWEDALTKNPDVVNILFTPRDRRLITQFGKTAARILNPVSGGTNPSNTSAGMANLVQKMAQWFIIGEQGQTLIGRWLPSIHGSVMSGGLASRARMGASVVPKRMPIPPGAPGAVGAMAGSQGVDLGSQ